MKVVTSEEMRSLEERSNLRGIHNRTLMEKAGLEIALSVSHEIGFLREVPILILVGPGNNGSDGLIAGMYLSAFGAKVTAVLLSGRSSSDTILAKVVLSDTILLHLYKDESQETLDLLAFETKRSFVIVDAIFGLGINRPITGFLAKELAVVDQYKRSDSLVFAVDAPTGLFIDTGQLDKSFLVPDITLALGVVKMGHITQPGASRIGRLKVLDIGIPDNIEKSIKCNLITKEMASEFLVDRPSDSNKGTFGKAFIIGGSENYIGAVGFAAEAAYRSGVGLATIAVPREICLAVATAIPEATVMPLNLNQPNSCADETNNTRLILEATQGYSSLLFGCGIGLSSESGVMLNNLLLSGVKLPPAVLDADGLNLISKVSNWWDRLPSGTVLTPHPGEMATLTGNSISEIQSNRKHFCQYYARKWNTIVVLKGANTVISCPSGETWISPWSNSTLSVAGTGDVLSGLIAGFRAQGISAVEASILAVYIHGFAGEYFTNTVGALGLLASDLLPILPKCIETLKKG